MHRMEPMFCVYFWATDGKHAFLEIKNIWQKKATVITDFVGFPLLYQRKVYEVMHTI